MELRKGAKGAAHGCYITTGGGIHTQWPHFHLFLGRVGRMGRIGKGVGHKLNVDTAPLTKPSYDCLSPSTLPAERGPHCLPYCNTNYSISVLVGPNDEGTLAGLSQDEPFSAMLLREHGSMGVAVVHGCMNFGAASAD